MAVGRDAAEPLAATLWPDPFALVFHPWKVYPTRVGTPGSDTAEPGFTFIVVEDTWDGNMPPFASHVTTYASS